jgi:hypothetical protein
LIASGAYDVYLSYGQSADGMSLGRLRFLLHYDFALFAVAYMLILIGNLQGLNLGLSRHADVCLHDPLLGRIRFCAKWLFEYSFLRAGIPWPLFFIFSFFFSMRRSSSPAVMTYIRTTQYLRNTYANYIGLRTWCLLFVIFNVLALWF